MLTVSSRPSFDEYVSTRSGVLLRFAYLLCGDRHLAEDLVQEVLIKAHRRWDTIEADNPDAYLKRALVHAHVSWRRRRAATEITTDTFDDRDQAARFDDVHASRDELWAALATLPRTQRAVLVLRYFEDLDDARIAELAGVSGNTVRVHAHRGLQAMREMLAQKAEEAPTSQGMLAKVQRGAARASTRRRIAAAGGLTAVIAALALALPMLLPDSATPPPINPTPTPTSTMHLVPTALSAPQFPYSFGDIPPGLSPNLVSQYRDDGATVTFLSFGESLAIGVREDQPKWGDWPEDAVSSPATVNGQPAVLITYPDSPSVGLTWEQDGRYFIAATDGALAIADLLSFVESMEPGSTAGGTAITNEIVAIGLPTGYVFSEWDEDRVCAGPAAHNVDDGQLCIELLPLRPQLPRVRDLTVDGDAAYIVAETVGLGPLVVERSDGRIVWVRFSDATASTDDLVAIYRAITFR
jgi:RNA polymerase sigma-70 factor (sigma-E family)